jgi:hypothetical protein
LERSEVIVRVKPETLELVTQPDHAALARRIMERCVALAGRPRRESILRAVGDHDLAWGEQDAAPTVDSSTGEIRDFIRVPLAVRHGVWPRTIARLADDPWAAALVAHHAWTVYGRFRPDPEWTAFFAAMESSRDELLGASGLPLGELEADYAYLRLGDLLSLAFCTAAGEEQRFLDWIIRADGSRVLVAPDPFGGAEVPLEVAAREIPRRPYRSDAELREAVAAARAITLRGWVAGRPA